MQEIPGSLNRHTHTVLHVLHSSAYGGLLTMDRHTHAVLHVLHSSAYGGLLTTNMRVNVNKNRFNAQRHCLLSETPLWE